MLARLRLDPNVPTLRRFGLIALLVLCALAADARYGWLGVVPELGAARSAVAAAALGLGLVSGACSALFPRGNRPLFVALSVLGYPIGLVISELVLALIFFCVVTPIALVLRLRGVDPLQRRLERGRASYWREARRPRGKESYFRPF